MASKVGGQPPVPGQASTSSLKRVREKSLDPRLGNIVKKTRTKTKPGDLRLGSSGGVSGVTPGRKMQRQEAVTVLSVKKNRPGGGQSHTGRAVPYR